MKKHFHLILLLLVLFPVAVFSRPTETMKQRRTRLERKYLSREAEWSASTGLFPEAPLPEEDAPDEKKEKYKKNNLFESDDSLSTSIHPRPRPVMRKKTNNNWLLATEDDDEEDVRDSSSSFFSHSSDEDSETSQKKKKKRLALLESMRRNAENPSSSRRSSINWFSQDEETPQNSQQGGLFSRSNGFGQNSEDELISVKPFSLFKKEPDPESPYTLLGSGNDPSTRSQPSSLGTGSSYQRRSPYSTQKNSSGSSSGFPSPFSSRSGDPNTTRQPNYVPYQSSSDASSSFLQDQGRTGGTGSGNQFQRQSSPYQKWKKRSSTRPNPMRDDAFVNEFMPKVGN